MGFVLLYFSNAKSASVKNNILIFMYDFCFLIFENISKNDDILWNDSRKQKLLELKQRVSENDFCVKVLPHF